MGSLKKKPVSLKRKFIKDYLQFSINDRIALKDYLFRDGRQGTNLKDILSTDFYLNRSKAWLLDMVINGIELNRCYQFKPCY